MGAVSIVGVAMKYEKISTAPFLENLANVYFQIVPEKYKKYCILNSQICQEVLRHFDIASFLIPAQLWFATDENNYIVGFVGHKPQPNIWDGHVVCATQDYIFDASVSHLRYEYGLDVPDISVSERFKIPSHVLSRQNVAGGGRLWWHEAPAVAQRHPVLEDVALVKSLARGLIARLEQTYAAELGAVLAGEAVIPLPRSAA